MYHSHVPDRRITLRPLAGAPTVGFPLPHPARPADDRAALGDWLELWMDAEIEPRRAETTVNGYRNIIRGHMRPALGAVPLSQLTPELINGYYQWLSDEKGLSPNTVRKHHILLHTALKSAYRQGVLPANPAERAAPPPPVRRTPPSPWATGWSSGWPPRSSPAGRRPPSTAIGTSSAGICAPPWGPCACPA